MGSKDERGHPSGPVDPDPTSHAKRDTVSTTDGIHNEHDVEQAADVSAKGSVSPKSAVFERKVDVSEAEVKLIMMAVVLSLTVVFLDGFILSPALPVIAVELAANDASYAWIASALLLNMAVSVPIWGKASDIFGRRNIMMLANLLFLLGAFIGGFATSATMLIAARAIQGLGCGGLAVVASICVIDLFSPRDRGVYFSLIGTVSAVASAAGPILGGVLSTKATWRWCFCINIPISAVSFFVMTLFLKLPRGGRSVREGLGEIDALGAFSLVTSTLLLLVGLQLGGTQYPWQSVAVICLIIVGVLLFIFFLWVEKALAKKPLIPLPVFMDISRCATTVVMITQAIVSSGVKTFLVLYFQLVLGASPLKSSIYFLPYAIGLSLILPFIGWSIKRTGKYKRLILSGSAVLTVGSGLLIDAKPQQDWPLIIIPQVLLAIGVGLTYQSSTIAFQAQVRQKYATAGQSAFQLLRNFSQMIGVILGQIILQAQVTNRFRHLDLIKYDSDLATQLVTGNTFTSLPVLQSLPTSQALLVKKLLAASFQDMWIFYTAIALLGAVTGIGITDIYME